MAALGRCSLVRRLHAKDVSCRFGLVVRLVQRALAVASIGILGFLHTTLPRWPRCCQSSAGVEAVAGEDPFLRLHSERHIRTRRPPRPRICHRLRGPHLSFGLRRSEDPTIARSPRGHWSDDTSRIDRRKKRLHAGATRALDSGRNRAIPYAAPPCRRTTNLPFRGRLQHLYIARNQYGGPGPGTAPGSAAFSLPG